MDTFFVHKFDDNLVVSTTKLPGFGKLGMAEIQKTNKTKQYLDLYYSGGFFKRNPSDEVMKKLTDQVVTIAQNYVNRRKIPGRVIDIKYTSALQPETQHVHSV